MTLVDAYFYLNGFFILAATALALTATNAIHGLLYFVLSIVTLALNFYLLDATLASALEVMVYAGAIMVLFVFVVMLLNIKYHEQKTPIKKYIGPLVLACILITEIIFILAQSIYKAPSEKIISVKDVALNLFNNYGTSIEIASAILLAGLIGVTHLGKKRSSP